MSLLSVIILGLILVTNILRAIHSYTYYLRSLELLGEMNRSMRVMKTDIILTKRKAAQERIQREAEELLKNPESITQAPEKCF